MKRKTYTTTRERKIDQSIGFVAFPLVNAVLFAANWLLAWAANTLHVSTQEVQLFQVCISLLPWIVNGIVLVLAFVFRPEVGIGYIAFVGVAICAGVVLSIFCVVACFTAGLVGNAFRGGGSFSIYAQVFFGLMSAGVLLLGLGFLAWVVRWWRRK